MKRPVDDEPAVLGLRDYGVAGAIGLEPTFEEHIDVLVRKIGANLWLLKGG